MRIWVIIATCLMWTLPVAGQTAQTAESAFDAHLAEGYEAYDFFEYDLARTSFDAALSVAQVHQMLDRLAQAHISMAILHHAQNLSQATELSIRAALKADCRVHIPVDYVVPALSSLHAQLKSQMCL